MIQNLSISVSAQHYYNLPSRGVDCKKVFIANSWGQVRFYFGVYGPTPSRQYATKWTWAFVLLTMDCLLLRGSVLITMLSYSLLGDNFAVELSRFRRVELSFYKTRQWKEFSLKLVLNSRVFMIVLLASTSLCCVAGNNRFCFDLCNQGSAFFEKCLYIMIEVKVL